MAERRMEDSNQPYEAVANAMHALASEVGGDYAYTPPPTPITRFPHNPASFHLDSHPTSISSHNINRFHPYEAYLGNNPHHTTQRMVTDSPWEHLISQYPRLPSSSPAGTSTSAQQETRLEPAMMTHQGHSEHLPRHDDFRIKREVLTDHAQQQQRRQQTNGSESANRPRTVLIPPSLASSSSPSSHSILNDIDTHAEHFNNQSNNQLMDAQLATKLASGRKEPNYKRRKMNMLDNHTSHRQKVELPSSLKDKTLEDLLSGHSEWQSILYEDIVNNCDLMTHKYRKLLDKVIGITIMRSIDRYESSLLHKALHSFSSKKPTDAMIETFIHHLFKNFPNIDYTALYRGRGSVNRFIENQRRELRLMGVLTSRTYKKSSREECTPAGESRTMEELCCSITQYGVKSDEWESIIQKTSSYRVQFAQTHTVQETFVRFPFMGGNNNTIVTDFAAMHPNLNIEHFVKTFDNTYYDRVVSIARECLGVDRVEDIQGQFDQATRKYSVISLLISCLSRYQKRGSKGAARVQYILNRYKSISDPNLALTYIRRDGLVKSPTLLLVGTFKESWITLESIVVKCCNAFSPCCESVGHSLVRLIAIYYVFNLKYDPLVSDFMSVIELLLGLQASSKSNYVRNIVSKIKL